MWARRASGRIPSIAWRTAGGIVAVGVVAGAAQASDAVNASIGTTAMRMAGLLGGCMVADAATIGRRSGTGKWRGASGGRGGAPLPRAVSWLRIQRSLARPAGYDVCAPALRTHAPLEPRPKRDSMPDDSRRKILWADDEIDLLRPHIQSLEQKDYAVTAVPNGEDALRAVSGARFDVVLLDEMMPGRGGLATLDAIKAKDLQLPVILITKSEEETLMEEAIGKRITDYLIKPVNPSQVYLACKRVLDSDKLQDTQQARDYVSEMQRWQSLDTRRLDWNGWVDLAVEVARWDVRFDNLREEGLRQAHLDFRRALNIDFGRFVEEGYRDWVQRADRRPRLSTDVVRDAVVPHLKQGRRVVFIVIDCMRLDQWFTLEPLL